MELRRVFLYGALMAIVFMMWTSWEVDYPSSPKPSAATDNQQALPGGILGAEQSNNHFVPTISQEVAQQSSSASVIPSVSEMIPEQRKITVQTDVLIVTIDTLGGNIIETKLLNYKQNIDDDQNPIVLLNNTSGTRYVAQSGVAAVGQAQPSEIQFSADKQNVTLQPSEDKLEVNLVSQDENGLQVIKTYRFKRDSYLIDLNYQLKNTAAKEWQGSIYNQLVRVEPPSETSWFHIGSYTGAAISDPENKLYEKISFSDIAKRNLNRTIKGGWAAMQQHYFISAWVPNSNQTSRYYSHDNGRGEYTIGYIGPVLQIPTGQQVEQTSRFYVGPALPDKLEEIAPGLDLTVDYGILWFISIFLFWVMKYIHQVVGNWGWSIVIVTLFIKLAFYHLSAKSYRSMANMRRLTPKMQALRERYADDKAKLSQATMDLYRKEKVNPLGGCLPILVQIPVFIALYWVLLESVDLRHAPFILWINDLSSPDPYFILPVLMGLTMFVQQKLNPAPPDPMQAKIMMALPFVFTLLFLTFPAGLVLYWTVNNGLSILQQWYITRSVENQSSNNQNNKTIAKAAND